MNNIGYFFADQTGNAQYYNALRVEIIASYYQTEVELSGKSPLLLYESFLSNQQDAQTSGYYDGGNGMF